MHNTNQNTTLSKKIHIFNANNLIKIEIAMAKKSKKRKGKKGR